MYGVEDGEGYAVYLNGAFTIEKRYSATNTKSASPVSWFKIGPALDSQMEVDDLAIWLEELSADSIVALYTL